MRWRRRPQETASEAIDEAFAAQAAATTAQQEQIALLQDPFYRMAIALGDAAMVPVSPLRLPGQESEPARQARRFGRALGRMAAADITALAEREGHEPA